MRRPALGPSGPLTGLQLFTKINCTLAQRTWLALECARFRLLLTRI